jgi:hypothetical protein
MALHMHRGSGRWPQQWIRRSLLHLDLPWAFAESKEVLLLEIFRSSEQGILSSSSARILM